MKRHVCVSVFMGFVSFAVPFASVWAQATAEISGQVRDQSGAVLPGVGVTVTQTETGAQLCDE